MSAPFTFYIKGARKGPVSQHLVSIVFLATFLGFYDSLLSPHLQTKKDKNRKERNVSKEKFVSDLLFQMFLKRLRASCSLLV